MYGVNEGFNMFACVWLFGTKDIKADQLETIAVKVIDMFESGDEVTGSGAKLRVGSLNTTKLLSLLLIHISGSHSISVSFFISGPWAMRPVTKCAPIWLPLTSGVYMTVSWVYSWLKPPPRHLSLVGHQLSACPQLPIHLKWTTPRVATPSMIRDGNCFPHRLVIGENLTAVQHAVCKSH